LATAVLVPAAAPLAVVATVLPQPVSAAASAAATSVRDTFGMGSPPALIMRYYQGRLDAASRGVTVSVQPVAARPRGRADTRQRLLEAVGELRAERGWAACSLQAVARRAGLTTGAVYSTFGSRGALLAAWMVDRVERHGLPEDEPDLVRAVTAFARDHYASTQDAEGLELVAMQLDLVRLAATDAPLAEALHEGYEQLMDGLVSALDARGAHARRLPTIELARRLVAVLTGLLIQKIGFSAPLTEQDFVDAALAVVAGSSG
jgi:AcrR family transcriptional regulator